MAEEIVVAKLDKDNRLIGYIQKKRDKVKEGELWFPECDLPTNGTYEWKPQEQTFVRLGSGHGKVTEKPPMGTDYVFYLILDSMGDSMPTKCTTWHAWYKKNLAKRNEEAMERRLIENG